MVAKSNHSLALTNTEDIVNQVVFFSKDCRLGIKTMIPLAFVLGSGSL
ncbi:MAG: hypothetical protein AB8Z23_00110 [Coxiella-like endosymbiont]|nr:hypothetical protein [Coxiella-like endosymbiont]UVE59400.1 hypothetical protein LG660_03280 [Coxiella-like endosymbiont]